MALITKKITLDITPGAIPQTVNVSQKDIGRAYEITLMDEGGVFEIPAGTTAKVEGTIAGYPFSEVATVTVSTVSFQLTEAMTAVSGKAWTKVMLTKDNEPVSSCAFILNVDRAGVEAKTIINAPGFQEQIDEAVAKRFDTNLKILVLGNSFSQDSFAYLPPVLNELLPGHNITYGVAYTASCGAIKHLEMYENDQNYDNFHLWRAGADHWSRYAGSGAAGYSLRKIMAAYDWDIVYMQSRGSIAADAMEQDMMDENITPGRELLRILQEGINSHFVFLSGQWLSFIEQSTGDTLASYFRMRKAMKYVGDRLGVDGVIPIGAGIAFARMDADLDALGDNGHLLYDTHQQAGLPALISTYVIAQYLLKMMGRAKSVYYSSFVPTAENVTAINCGRMTHGDPVGVTTENILKAQEIAVAAVEHPDSVYGETDPSEEGGGAPVTVDDALSTTSTNPVQNKVVKAAFDERDRLMQKCQIVTEASENRWNKDAADTGLLGLDGRLYTGGSYDNYCYYNIGNVSAGDVITSYKKQSTAVDSASMQRVVCYDSDGNAVVSAGTSTSTQSFTVPSGIASVAVCVTGNTGLTYNYMILVNAESAPTDYIPYVEHNVFYRATEDFLPKTSRLDKVNTLLGSDSPSAYAATLASGTTLTIDNAPYFIKKNVTVSARMEFETFASVEIGKGQNSYRGKSVIIDGTNITQVSYNDSGTAVNGSVIAHGLTVSDYLQVTMFMGDDGKCEVTINTTSGTFDTVFDFSAEWNYSPFVAGAQAMTDVQLGYSCSDIRCPMWVFGDSYLGLWDNRVGGQLRQLGFFNFALVGVAGGRANDGSKATYPDLQRMLALGTPKYIIWALGMNGGDAANVTFLPTLIALCEDKGIELILYKVPHIPTIDHSTLNAYIESTGLRYIDACAAVGATTAGVWYTGMLSNDEVHPSALGAKAIAMRFLTDAPEIMQYGKSEEYAAELPAVTASDNGKFLRVVSGVWAAETVQTYQGGSY